MKAKIEKLTIKEEKLRHEERNGGDEVDGDKVDMDAGWERTVVMVMVVIQRRRQVGQGGYGCRMGKDSCLYGSKE
ncbi:hypothetical protein YC2023_041366 [Brassica napus]